MPGSIVKPVPGNQAAVVVRLVVVHVDAVAVHLVAEAVAGAMDELRAESGALDHVAGRAIDFEAAELPSGPRRLCTSSTAASRPSRAAANARA